MSYLPKELQIGFAIISNLKLRYADFKFYNLADFRSMCIFGARRGISSWKKVLFTIFPTFPFLHCHNYRCSTVKGRDNSWLWFEKPLLTRQCYFFYIDLYCLSPFLIPLIHYTLAAPWVHGQLCLSISPLLVRNNSQAIAWQPVSIEKNLRRCFKKALPTQLSS